MYSNVLIHNKNMLFKIIIDLKINKNIYVPNNI